MVVGLWSLVFGRRPRANDDFLPDRILSSQYTVLGSQLDLDGVGFSDFWRRTTTTFSLIGFLVLSTQFSVLSWIERAWASRILCVIVRPWPKTNDQRPTTIFSLIEFLVLSTQFPVLSWIERVWAGDV